MWIMKKTTIITRLNDKENKQKLIYDCQAVLMALTPYTPERSIEKALINLKETLNKIV